MRVCPGVRAFGQNRVCWEEGELAGGLGWEKHGPDVVHALRALGGGVIAGGTCPLSPGERDGGDGGYELGYLAGRLQVPKFGLIVFSHHSESFGTLLTRAAF